MSTDLPDNVLFGRVGSHLTNNVLFGRAKGVRLLVRVSGTRYMVLINNLML